MRRSFYAALALIAGALSSAAAHAQVAQESGYQLAYQLDILAIPYNGGGAATFNSTGVPYSVDNSGSIATGSFTRVAYEWTLSGSTDSSSPNGTMWISFDTQSPVANQLGVPAIGTGEFYDQSVSNMNVVTTLPGLSGTGITNGTIQFWPSNYGQNGNGNFDWHDSGGNASSGYGHMEVGETDPANPLIGQVLGSFVNWGGNGGPVGIGIGNRPGDPAHADYTFATNANSYTSAVLTVWVNPVPEPSSVILFGLGTLGLFAVARRRK